MNISEINCILTESLKNLLPDFSEMAKVYPLPQVGSAHFASKVIFEYADRVKKDPKKVALDLEDKLSIAGLDISLEAGYINLSLQDLDSKLETFEEKPSVSIYIPEDSLFVAPGEYIRLTASLIIQLQCLASLSAQYKVYQGQKETSLASLIDTFANIADFQTDSAEKKEEYYNFLVKQLENSKNIILYLTPNTFPRSDFNNFYKNFKENVKLVCPTKIWLKGVDRKLIEQVTRISADNYLPSCLHIASHHQASELDLREIELDHSNNLLWFSKTLLERIEKFNLPKSNIESLLDCNTNEEKIIIWSKYFDYYLFQAAFLGEVQNFVQLLHEFISTANSYVNSPELRRKIEVDQLSSKELALLQMIKETLLKTIKLFYSK